MDLEPLPPSPPNPNPVPNTPTIPPDKPPDTKNAPCPFENIPKSSLDNPYNGLAPVDQAELHWKSLEEAERMVKALFEF
jgi:hypothetical protein